MKDNDVYHGAGMKMLNKINKETVVDHLEKESELIDLFTFIID